MSGKLDQSLDDILTTRRQTKGRGRGGRPVAGRRAKATTATATGGITKTNTKGVRTAAKGAAPVRAMLGSGESKIIVTGLPVDVTETQIKEYFAKTIGPVKKVVVTYGPNGQSRGIATITFLQAGSATTAAKQLNGVKVDNRAMKIEVIVGADQAVPVTTKGLGDRVSQPKSAAPKNKAKAAAATTNGAAATKGGRGGRSGRGGRQGRGKPKTADELDAEMTDYFVPKAEETNGTAVSNAPAVDASMDDQIM